MHFCCAILISIWSCSKGTIQWHKQRLKLWSKPRPTFNLPKTYPYSPGSRWIHLWATKSEDDGLIVHAVSFQDVVLIHQRYKWTDRQTDSCQTTCDRKTALCTIVHCAIKIIHDMCVTATCAEWWSGTFLNGSVTDRRQPQSCNQLCSLYGCRLCHLSSVSIYLTVSLLK